ncbi:MAG TPA: enoyl-CoA hydratase, partial [Polyangia bacterium]|nr:enoyl-CoA hydratase [Polyangia bacterium]
RAIAGEVASRSPDAVAAAKLALQEAWLTSEGDALGSERRWQRRLIGFKNQRIAIKRNQKKEDLPFVPRRLGD